jgi:periplasmic protein TonB
VPLDPLASRRFGLGESSALKRGAVAAVLISLLLHGSVWQLLHLAPETPEPPVTPPKVMEVSLVSAPPAKPAAPAEPPQARAEPVKPPPPKAKKPDKPKSVPKPAVKPLPEPEPEAERPSRQDSQPAPTEPFPPGSAARETAKAAAPAPAPYVDASYKSPALHNPPTRYPPMAAERRWEGSVQIRVQVLPDGTAGAMKVERSSGHEMLDESAMEQVSKWRFVPARRGDQTVSAWVIVPLEFKLKH